DSVTTADRPSGEIGRPRWKGCTSPCRSQRHALDQRSGGRTGWAQRGHVGGTFMEGRCNVDDSESTPRVGRVCFATYPTILDVSVVSGLGGEHASLRPARSALHRTLV